MQDRRLGILPGGMPDDGPQDAGDRGEVGLELVRNNVGIAFLADIIPEFKLSGGLPPTAVDLADIEFVGKAAHLVRMPRRTASNASALVSVFRTTARPPQTL